MWVGFWDLGEYERCYKVELDVAYLEVCRGRVKCWAKYWGLVLDGVPAEVRRGEDPAPCRLFDRVARLVERALRECPTADVTVTRVGVDDEEGNEIEGTETFHSIYGCHHVAAQLWRLATERMARGDLTSVKINALLRLEPCVGTLEEVLRCVAERFARVGLRAVRVWASAGDKPVDDPERAWDVEVETEDGRRFWSYVGRKGGMPVVWSMHSY